MNHFLNIIKKEIKELLTPTTLLPIIAMTLIFAAMGNLIGGAVDEAKEKPVLGVINLDSGYYSNVSIDVINNLAKVVYNGTSDSNLDESVKTLKERKGTALLLIPQNFSDLILANQSAMLEVYWIMKGVGIMDMISSSVVESIIYSISQQITVDIITKNNINSSFTLSPIKKIESTIVKERWLSNISPNEIGTVLQSQSTTVPLIMMLIIIMAGGMVISSMSFEKENKTLETLLTLPIKRTSIVAGKIVGSAIVGLLMAIIYMIGFGYYLQSFQESSAVDLAEHGLSLGLTDYVLIGISVFLALLAALSFCMVLGTFAKNYKSAQTLTVPVSVLAIIPMFMIMFKDFDTLPSTLQAVLFAIPFSHPMMAMRSLLFGNITLVIAGIVYVFLFSLCMIAIAVWIFSTDKLLTGRIQNNVKTNTVFKLLKKQ